LISKTLFVTTTLITVILLTGLLIFYQKSGRRDRYEKYLLAEYKGIGELTGADTGEACCGQPDRAALRDYFMTFDPTLERVPTERLAEARRQTLAYHKELLKRGLGKDLEWIETSSNMGGRTRAVMWDPNDPSGKAVWAGGVTSGLWFNDDLTGSASGWQPVSDFWSNLSVSCIAFDPNDPQIYYVGTGEAQTATIMYRESSGVGAGIWKSADGGGSWNLLPSTEDFKYITEIRVRNENGNSVVYAGVVSGFYHGVNHQSLPTDGLYRSVDGGLSWEQVLPCIPGEEDPFAPGDIDIGADGRIYVGTMPNLDGKGAAVILFSDEGTAGSWTLFDDYVAVIQSDPDFPIPGRVVLSCAASDANILYAIVASGFLNNQGFRYFYGTYILRSDDRGLTWAETAVPYSDPSWATLAWHALTCAVDPNDPETVFIGGLDIWRTKDGGDSWAQLTDWTLLYTGGGDNYVHGDQHVQLFRPGSSDEMLFGNDGGVFYTSDAGSLTPVFIEKNKNYSTLQFYTCDIYPVTGQNIFVGGLQDNATLLYQGEPFDISDVIDIGDGAYCWFDEDEPEIMISSYFYNRYSLFLNFNFVTDFGTSSGTFISPADYDSRENILYANACGFTGASADKILRCTGIPDNITCLKVPINTGLSTYFTQVKVSPYAPTGTSTLYVGSQNGRLFRVTDAQAAPQTTEIGGSNFPAAYLSCVAIGGSEDTLLVTFSNYGVQKIFQTTDGGLLWEDKTGNMPDMPVRWALYHPQDAKEAMVATEIGVWVCYDLGQTTPLWQPAIDGLAMVRVDMLQVRTTDNTVLAATHGRGLYKTVWEAGPPLPVADFTADHTTVLQGQSVHFTDLSTGNPTAWSWTFEGGEPSTSDEQTPPPIAYLIPGSHTVSLTVSNPYGSDTVTKADYIYVEPVGREELSGTTRLLVQPNPSPGAFSLSFLNKGSSAVTVTIRDMGGKEVYGATFIRPPTQFKIRIDLAGAPKGVYLLGIAGGGKIQTSKVVIR
jgi:photosystem II stability/assembly factor-like uncharacterized protein